MTFRAPLERTPAACLAAEPAVSMLRAALARSRLHLHEINEFCGNSATAQAKHRQPSVKPPAGYAS